MPKDLNDSHDHKRGRSKLKDGVVPKAEVTAVTHHVVPLRLVRSNALIVPAALNPRVNGQGSASGSAESNNSSTANGVK